MVRVSFTSHLRRHLRCPDQTVEGSNVREVLEHVFVNVPELRAYVLDDQGSLRKHVVIFVDGSMIADRLLLSDPLGPEAELHVMQALSGG